MARPQGAPGTARPQRGVSATARQSKAPAKEPEALLDLIRKIRSLIRDRKQFFRTEELGTTRSLESDLSQEIDAIEETLTEIDAVCNRKRVHVPWALEVEIKQSLEKFSELLTKAKSADPQVLDSERGGIVSGLRNGHGVLLRSASPLLLRDLNAGIAEHDQEIKSACQELVEQSLKQNADRLDKRLTAEAENSRVASAALHAAHADLEKKLDLRVEEVAQRAAKLTLPETREIQKRSEDAIQELQDMLAKARKIMSDEAFHQHAVAFNKSAKDYRRSARFWLGTAGLFAASTLGIAIWRLLDPDVSPERIIAQAIVTSILLTFTFVATRGYRIAVHNALIAEQRRDALATVDNFVAAANGEQSRTAVLLQATNAIFSFAPTTPGAEAGQDGLSTSALSILQEISKEKRRG